MKHLDVSWLWIREAVRKGDLVLRKINGKVNPADLLTKPKSAAEAARLSEALGYRLVIRKAKEGDSAENLAGIVHRMMKGDRREEAERMDTVTWWMEKAGSEDWKHGGVVYMVEASG